MSVNWKMYRGDTITRHVHFVQAEDTRLAYDLTGLVSVTITGDTTRNPTDESTQLWEIAMSIAGSPTLGAANFALDATQADLTPGVYYFDVEGVDGIGGKITMFKGTFQVVQDINK